MPLTKIGKKMLKKFKREHGKRGKAVLYAYVRNAYISKHPKIPIKRNFLILEKIVKEQGAGKKDEIRKI